MSLPVQLGRLRRVRQLGAGGFATVWLYHDDELDSDVAVKALASNWAQDPVIRDRFLAESRLLRRAESDHVVEVHDIGVTDDGIPWFVMTYADQGSVAELARRGRPTPPEVADLIGQAARGLAALHDHGIVHRDIKPENLLLQTRPDGGRRVLVADLGVAKLLVGDRAASQHVGTAAYAAPEQSDPRIALDPRADVHGLGAVAYELITGKAPRAGLRYDQTPAPPSSLVPGVPPTVDAIVTRAVEPDRTHRWGDVTSFARALEAAILGRPVPVPIPPPPPPVRTPTARPGWLAPVLAAGGLVLVAAVALGVWAATRGGSGGLDASAQYEEAAVDYVRALQSPTCVQDLKDVTSADSDHDDRWHCSDRNDMFAAAQCLDPDDVSRVESLDDTRYRVWFGSDHWAEVTRGSDTILEVTDLKGCD